MIIARPLYLCTLPVLAILSGCATTADRYPSLAVRDVEQAGENQAAAVPVAPATPDEAVARLSAALRAANVAFVAALGQTRSRVNAAGPMGSESWSTAEVALADLRSHRSTAMVALADLDRIFLAAASEGQPTGAIAPARTEAETIVAGQDETLDGLIRQLSR